MAEETKTNEESIEETTEVIEEEIDPKKKLIRIKANEVIEEFSIQDLEIQVNNINDQIKRIRDYYRRELTGLQEEKERYLNKITENAYEGYEMPNFDIDDTLEEAQE